MDPQEIKRATRSFVTPSELAGSRPRDVQLSAGGRFVYAVALVLFGGALAAMVLLNRLSVTQTAEREAFQKDSVTTSAEVTRLWRQSNDSKQPWVAYRFELNGAAFDGRAKVRLARWRTLQTGSAIEIRYLPAHPESNFVAGTEPDVLPAFVPFLLGSFLAAGGVLILVALNSQRRLLAEGRAAPAIVTDVRTSKTTHGGTQRSIKYTFPLLSGAIANGKSDAPRKTPAVGGVICVVYDPDRPRRSRLYPFPFVRTARL